MEECVKLNGKTIVCIKWSPVTPLVLLHIVKVQKQQSAGQNRSEQSGQKRHFIRSYFTGQPNSHVSVPCVSIFKLFETFARSIGSKLAKVAAGVIHK